MAELFRIDGEDVGSTPWEFDLITNQADASFALDDTNPYEGTYAYRYLSAAVEEESSARAYADKVFTEQTEIYIVMRIYIPSTWDCYQGGMLEGPELAFLDGVSTKGYMAVWIDMQPEPAGWFFSSEDDWLQDDTNFSANAYHVLQAHIVCGASGKVEFWVDGEHVVSWDEDLTGVAIDKIRVGNVGPSIPSSGQYADFDLILVHDAEIPGYSWPAPNGGGGDSNHKYFMVLRSIM